MEKSTLTWFPIVCIGLGNLYWGRIIGEIGIPFAVRGRRSPLTVILFGGCWLWGLVWLYRLNGLQLTFLQACLLAAMVWTSESTTRKWYGLNPKVPWAVTLNTRLDTITRICARHSWGASGAPDFAALPRSTGIHFDGADFDMLQRMLSDEEFKWRQQMPLNPLPSNPGPEDYDRACAREIVTLANMLRGTDGVPGLIQQVSGLHDLSDLHWPAYESLLRLADVIASQWTLEALWVNQRSSKQDPHS